MAITVGAQSIEIAAKDIDSLSVLPLAILPIDSQALRRVRMVKDSKLQSAIEMFSGESVGNGLIYPSSLRETFPSITIEDYGMLMAVAELHSFDVYSLRISLRNIGIEVDSQQYLCLSDEKQRELQDYIRSFTERLIRQIYGSDSDDVDTTSIATLFYNPDVNAARKNLGNFANSIAIPLHEVPKFLQDYGDIYLSVAYYQNCLDRIQPIIDDFLASTGEITQHKQMKQNLELVRVCQGLEAKLRKLQGVVLRHFAVFARSTEEMWENLSAEQFSEFKKMVEDNHTVMGSVLCTLSVIMTVWNDKFPFDNMAGPNRRADFIMAEMRQGLLT